MVDTDAVLRGTGPAAIVLGTGGMLLATLLSPAFSWTRNALSDLGVTRTAAGTELTAVVFNGSLIAAGIVGLGFAVALERDARSGGHHLVAGLFGLTVLAMGLVGVFPLGTDLHVPVAVTFFVLVSLVCWTDGVVRLTGGDARRGGRGLLLGSVNVVGWVVWSMAGGFARGGAAIPEFVGALAFSGWVLWAWFERSATSNPTKH